MILSPASLPVVVRRACSLALIAALGFGLSGGPSFAAKAPKRPRAAAKKERTPQPKAAREPKAPEAAEAPEPPRIEYPRIPVNPNLPSEISIVPHLSEVEKSARQRREAEIRRALAPRAEAWSRAFRAEAASFAGALDAALGTLRTAVGRGSRNVCYPLEAATDRLAAALPEAPEARLEAEIRTALSRVAHGARICLEGRPTTAQTEIRSGAAVLVRAAETILSWGR